MFLWIESIPIVLLMGDEVANRTTPKFGKLLLGPSDWYDRSHGKIARDIEQSLQTRLAGRG